ncbi:hypothetical protein VaNZ11_003011, partial [Volvox africanus]
MGTPLEEDVGITGYVSPVPGFQGILKHRFRDFLVREVDLKGQVARLTSLEPDVKAEDDFTGPAARDLRCSPEQLAATRAHVVASFSLVAGGENGALLDDLLRRVLEMYGIKVDLLGEGRGAEASAHESDSGGINATGAVEAAGPSLPDGAAPKPSVMAGHAGEALSNAEASGTCGGAGGDGGGGTGGGGGEDAGEGEGDVIPGRGRGKLQRLSVLLLPIASKEVRKAVHEFFRTTPGLPPMRTEAISTQQHQAGSEPAAQQQHGGKRGPPDGAQDGRPAKWQREGGRGGGRGGRGRAGEAQKTQATTTTTTTTCIEIAFDPYDLEEGGAGAVTDSGRGRGGR